VNYDNSLVVTITVTCYSWAPSSGDHLFSCGAISRPPHIPVKFAQSYEKIWIQHFQQFIGICIKSNVTTGHKNVKHEALYC